MGWAAAQGPKDLKDPHHLKTYLYIDTERGGGGGDEHM